ncbi:glycoside hydrolase family 3 protein [Bifidobacterium choloepi]|uniref:Beta-glucosidase n=1 Tax=Bifidobacterium choloepi TaxID=2614131 RepID=A0A6I5N186_9BIFI|nr:glycoside hydrolase family 3 protein [Bifidobacterium choloepi]NEG69409.1 beta-glucosidase [Bifidobacterium choloepi]
MATKPTASPDQHDDFRSTPLWDESLPISERVEWLLDELTIDDKLSLLASSTPAIPRLGIGPFNIGGEAAHGVEARHDQDGDGPEPDGSLPHAEHTTSLPQPIGMSATWDASLLERAGALVGVEARALYRRNPRGGLCRWAPTVDLERDPRWGRTEEGYGEDPVLTGAMAGAYVRGLQGGGPEDTRDHLRVSAALKHFFANNVEDGRCVTSSTVGARDRREYYLEPFRRCIQDAGASSVMTAYNAVNGTVEMHDARVRELLRGEDGLYGHVVSDGGAMRLVHDARGDTDSHAQTVARALKAGVDCIVDDPDLVREAATQAYREGLVDIGDIDEALRHSFTTKLRLGLFDARQSNPFAAVPADAVDSAEHRRLARQVTDESLVLLKNDGLLPLRMPHADGGTPPARIAVVGPLADRWYRDWYGGEPNLHATIADGVRDIAGAGVDVAVDDALDVVLLKFDGRYAALGDDARLRAVGDAAQAERFRLQDWGHGALTFVSETTGRYLTALDDGSIAAIKDMPFGWFVKETFHRDADGNLCIYSDVPVSVDGDGNIVAAGGTDLASQRVGVPQTHGFGTASSRGAVLDIDVVERGVERAGKLAAAADVVIAAVGCCPVINGKEDEDRPSTGFPPSQHELVRRLVAANPDTAMVLVANYPVDIDWEEEHVPAILLTASGSQCMGDAVADALFGAVAPAGRLPMTWYGAGVDLPDKNDYDMIGGGRTYQWHRGPVLYPFGHGLTYAPFSYMFGTLPDGGLRANAAAADVVHVPVAVANHGDVTSDAVVEAYVRYPHEEGNDPVPMPVRRLVGFVRERQVKPGEERRAVLEIPMENLRIYDVRRGDYRVPDGRYALDIGASSGDIRASMLLDIAGEPPRPRPLGEWIPVDHWDAASNIALVAVPVMNDSSGDSMTDRPAATVTDHLPADACLATVHQPDRPGTLAFGGFEPMQPGRHVRLASDNCTIGSPVVLRVGTDDIIADPDGTFPLPEGTVSFTLVLTGEARVCAVRVD